MLKCNSCQGSGLEPGRTKSRCPTCFGDKKLISMVKFVKTTCTCFTCGGLGICTLEQDKCISCHGLGVPILITPEPVEIPLLLEAEYEPEVKTALTLKEKVKAIKLPSVSMPKNPFKRKKPTP